MLPNGGAHYFVVNGVPLTGDAPPVSTFLQTTSGAYTTTRTDGHASVLLFWDRHLRRLAESARILAESRPDLLGSGHRSARALALAAEIRPLVRDSLRAGLGLALGERGSGDEELAVTMLVRGREDEMDGLDVFLHIGCFAPPVFGAGGGVRLAVAGRGRQVAAAKYADWVRVRKGLGKMKPPLVTELLLSNDGNHILEGTVTNFFVVCRKVVIGITDDTPYDLERRDSFEVQTAPVSNGVLPGIIRQLVIEVCSSCGIPLREVAPSWSDRELWEEAFVTSSLRLLQHVETIQAPISSEKLHQKTWEDVSWVVKQFKGVGVITTQIQKEIMARAGAEGYQLSKFFEE